MTDEVNDLNELMLERYKKLEALEEAGVPAYNNQFDREDIAAEVVDNFEELKENEETVKVAGRIMALRNHGKSSFADLFDMSGKIQLYVKKNKVGEEEYELFADLNIGDHIGVEGTLFRTRHGEITVRVERFVLLSKSLRPLPEKWHGLKDVELRYRQRYVDLVVNPGVREKFVTRSKIIHNIRKCLEDKGFLEVQTPLMHQIAGGAAARPFVTHHNALDIDLYMRIAPELHLKRLLVGGFEKVFEIGKNMRNEGLSTKHNPEFTSMELYQAYANYQDMMDITEDLIKTVANEALDDLNINYGDLEINLDKWHRMTMVEAIKEHAGVDFSKVDTLEEVKNLADEHHVEYADDTSMGEIINSLKSLWKRS